jgi:sulfide:quinone oxidoreductase
MKPRTLDERLSVLPQIQPEDLSTLAAMGFRSVISNRPDGEAPDQPATEEISRAAMAAGLEFAHVPVVGNAISERDIERFGSLLISLPGPVLAFCRTGTRSSTLWALSQAGQQPLTQLLAAAAEAGFDLSARRKDLRCRHHWRRQRRPGSGLQSPAARVRLAHLPGRTGPGTLLPARLDDGRRRRVQSPANRAADGQPDPRRRRLEAGAGRCD